MGRKLIATPERVRAAMGRLRLDGVEITYRNGRVFGLSEVRGATGGGTDRVRALVLLALAEEGARIPRELIRDARGRVLPGGAPVEIRRHVRPRRTTALPGPDTATPDAAPRAPASPDPTLAQIRDILSTIRHDMHALLDLLTSTLQFALSSYSVDAKPESESPTSDARIFRAPAI